MQIWREMTAGWLLKCYLALAIYIDLYFADKVD